MLFVKWREPQQIAQSQSAEKTAASSGQKDEPKTFWQKVTADPVATFTLFLVVIAGAQASFFVIQLAYMRKGMEDATTVAKAAKVSADAAMKSAVVAENALIATDRAWISIEAEIIAPLVFEKDRIHIGIGFGMTNIGSSPATHVGIWAELCADMPEAREQGRKAANRTALGLLDFGVVVFPKEVERGDWWEMEMPTPVFMQSISAARVRAKERGDDESEWSTTWPCVMACATYRLVAQTFMSGQVT
jgi:hypothetical protein